jgi:Putative Ig domain
MPPYNSLRSVFLILLTILVAACGGDGGSGNSTATTTTTPAATPAAFYGSSTRQYTTGIPAYPVTPGDSVVKTSAIKRWSITPALPAGLTFDSSTGVISGTPTTISPTSAYVVTGVSSAGQGYSANLSIGVTSNVLLNLGHIAPMQFIQFDTSHVLSEDVTGRWILWNYATAAQIASGGAELPDEGNGVPAVMALAGPTLVIATLTGLELRSSATGAVAAEITAALKWWKLATDGSYVCGGNSSQLQCWSPSGQLLFSEAGDYNYSIAHVFAAPSGLLVALDNGVIETVSSATWTSSVGPPFQGTFYAWFVDGSHFLTTEATSNAVYEYSLASALEGSVSLPSLQGLVGQGNWIWTAQPSYATAPDGDEYVASNAVTIYPVGSSATPAATLQLGGLLMPTDTFIDSLSVSGTSVTVVDLSGATPAETSYSLPIAVPGPQQSALIAPPPFMFVAFSPTQFMESGGSGFLVDGSVPGAPRDFDYGAIISIAGSTARAVFTTASGNAFTYNSATNALENAAALASAPLAPDSQLSLSSDGSVLAAIDTSGNVVVYSLPGWTLINTLPAPISIVLSGSGTTLGEASIYAIASAQSVPVTGGAATSDPGPCMGSAVSTSCPIQVSPDGTLAAVASESLGTMNYEVMDSQNFIPPTSAISRNGALLATVPGYPVAWLDDSRLLVNSYAPILDMTEVSYTGATIYGPTGTKLAAPPIEEIDSLQVVSSDLVYSQQSNEVISLTSGASTWVSQDPFGGPLGPCQCGPEEPQWGVFAGSAIVFVSGNLVVAQPY